LSEGHGPADIYYGIQKFTDSGAAITTLRHCMNEAAQS